MERCSFVASMPILLNTSSDSLRVNTLLSVAMQFIPLQLYILFLISKWVSNQHFHKNCGMIEREFKKGDVNDMTERDFLLELEEPLRRISAP